MSEKIKPVEPQGRFVGLFANITEVMLGDLPTRGDNTYSELVVRREWDKLRLHFLSQGINVNTAPELNSISWPKREDGLFEISSVFS